MNVFTNEFLDLLTPDDRSAIEQLPVASILDILRPQIKQNSVQKGQYGEKWFETLVKERMPDCRLEKTASTKWSGDFVIKKQIGSRDMTIMVDIKNYSNTVPRDEIAKFYRDIDIRRYDAGMLLSLNTRFAGTPDDSDIYFSTVASAGRDVNTVLLCCNTEIIIVHTLRYMLGIAAYERELIVNHAVVKALRDVQSRIAQMSKMRYEIQNLNSTITSSLGRLSNDLMDIEVRTGILLDSVFANIDQKQYVATTLEDIETAFGSTMRTATLKFLKSVDVSNVSISDDKKYIRLPRVCISCFATKDKISIHTPVLKDHPEGEYSFKRDTVTFDLIDCNVELAVKLTNT